LFATAANLGIVEIDPVKGSILAEFPAPSPQGVADGLAYDGRLVYYLNGSREPDRLYGLDPDTGMVSSVSNLPESSFRNGLAALDGRIYVLDWSAITQDISVWSPDSDRIVQTIDINGTNPGAPAVSGGLAAISEPNGLLVTTAQTEELLEVHPTSGRIVRRFTHGLAGVLGVAVIDGEIFLGTNTSPDLHVFSRSGQMLRTVPVERPIGFQSLAGDALSGFGCTIHLPLSIRMGS
jgi:hypothetical protein